MILVFLLAVKDNECLNVNMANTEHIETWGNGSGMLLIILLNNIQIQRTLNRGGNWCLLLHIFLKVGMNY